MLDHPSVEQLVTHVLLHDTGVQALVGNRVHGGWPRDPDLDSIDKPACGVVLDSGQTAYDGVWGQFGLEVWALSSDSKAEALKLYRAIFDALKAECLQIDAVGVANGFDHRGMATEQDGPRAGWSTSAACWYVQARWILTVFRDTTGSVP